MGEPLKTPPLIEAVCELRLPPSQNWDWTIPGRLWERLKDEFPERDQQVQVRFDLIVAPVGSPRMAIDPHRVRMKRVDGAAMVQVAPDLLAINRLAPYLGWADFRSLIQRVVGAYLGLGVSLSPARIGLRYINTIKGPHGGGDPRAALTVLPSMPSALAKSPASFYQRYEIPSDDPSGVLIHQTGLRKDGGNSELLLDLDFGSSDVGHVTDAGALLGWLDSAHQRLGEAFVASLTAEKYKELRG